MHRFLSMKRLTILFFSVFAVLITGTVVFQSYWLDPGERCEKDGKWYDVESRTCAVPIYIPDITGRPAGVTRAEASAEKNRELLALEREVANEQRAVNAQIEKQRQEFVGGSAN